MNNNTISLEKPTYDEGLRSYMIKVYNYMMASVLLTGVLAFWFSAGGETSYAQSLLTNNPFLSFGIILSPLVLILVMGLGMERLSVLKMQTLLWAFAALEGIALSMVFLSYDLGTISSAFFATAAAFAGLSLWGYTTKKDLSGWGSFLIMGVIGLIVAMVINLFLQSSMLELLVSIIGVLIFAGLMAHDTQRIKDEYRSSLTGDAESKIAIWGALSLYLDFLNMFLFLLRIFGFAGSDD